MCVLCVINEAEQSSIELPKQSCPVLFGMPRGIPPDSSCCSRRSQVPVGLVSCCQRSCWAQVPQVSAVALGWCRTVGWAVTKLNRTENRCPSHSNVPDGSLCQERSLDFKRRVVGIKQWELWAGNPSLTTLYVCQVRCSFRLHSFPGVFCSRGWRS